MDARQRLIAALLGQDPDGQGQLMPPPSNPAAPPEWLAGGVRSAGKHIADWMRVPGDLMAGKHQVAPEVPGQWSDVDESRAQLNQRGLDDWAFKSSVGMVGSPVAPLPERLALDMAGNALAGKGGTTLGSGAMRPSGIRGWHGSPHDFNAEALAMNPRGELEYLVGKPDIMPVIPPGYKVQKEFPLGRFREDKIGTGEGAASFGHGAAYIGGNPAVATEYRKTLSAKAGLKPTVGGAPMHWVDRSVVSDYPGLASGRMSLDDAIAMAMDMGRPTHAALFKEMKTKGGITPPGRMYEVDINAKPERFLDWDKPITGQGQSVRDAIGSRMSDEQPTGAFLSRAYRNPAFGGDLIGKGAAHPEAVTRGLAEAGIPGIKYLDQGSRSAGQGSSNYVVFDPSIIEILRKYGLAGASPVGAALLASQQDQAAQ